MQKSAPATRAAPLMASSRSTFSSSGTVKGSTSTGCSQRAEWAGSVSISTGWPRQPACARAIATADSASRTTPATERSVLAANPQAPLTSTRTEQPSVESARTPCTISSRTKSDSDSDCMTCRSANDAPRDLARSSAAFASLGKAAERSAARAAESRQPPATSASPAAETCLSHSRRCMTAGYARSSRPGNSRSPERRKAGWTAGVLDYFLRTGGLPVATCGRFTK